MELIVESFSGGAVCRFDGDNYRSYVPEFSYTFKPGIYALLGDIDLGGWAFSYALDPIREKDVYVDRNNNGTTKEKFYVDGKEVTLDYLRTISTHLNWYAPRHSDPKNRSGQKQIQKAIRQGKSQYTVEELKKMFTLDEERFTRPLYCTGNEKWRITAAIGLAQGKKIFCYPWFSATYLSDYVFRIKMLEDMVRGQGVITLLPVANLEFVKDFVDGVVDLRYRTWDGELTSESCFVTDNKIQEDVVPDRKAAIELADVILKNYPKPDIYKNCSFHGISFDKRDGTWDVRYYDFTNNLEGKACSVMLRQKDGKVLGIWFQE
jgi:hypothetical protein